MDSVLALEPRLGFQALYSRDVNNYIAIKKDGKIKSKGAYAKPEYAAERLHKNPTAQVCLDAVPVPYGGVSVEGQYAHVLVITEFVS